MNTEDRLKNMLDAARVESTPTGADWNAFARRAHRSLFARRAAVVVGGVTLIAVGAFSAIALTSNPISERPLPPGATGTAEPSPTQAPPDESIVYDIPASEQELWYVRGERLAWGTFTNGGEISADLAPAEDRVAQRAAYWLQLMIDGGLGFDHEGPNGTAIPKGTELLGVERDLDGLHVDLSSEFESGGGSLSMQMRVAQIVYTATQFEGVDAVSFKIEGKGVDSIGGEGIDVSEPLTRRDFQESYIAPNIVVESPRPGDEIADGATITGFANVFEANVNYRLVDENGDVLDEGFTTATCGSGCWGDFEIELDFEVGSRQEGRVEVLTFSAEDGSEQDVVSIPVVLVP
ncbi:MAG: Gmad2 immunoglobulin-like domain-containing protein [Actinomycetota bacterium]